MILFLSDRDFSPLRAPSLFLTLSLPLPDRLKGNYPRLATINLCASPLPVSNFFATRPATSLFPPPSSNNMRKRYTPLLDSPPSFLPFWKACRNSPPLSLSPVFLPQTCEDLARPFPSSSDVKFSFLSFLIFLSGLKKSPSPPPGPPFNPPFSGVYLGVYIWC